MTPGDPALRRATPAECQEGIFFIFFFPFPACQRSCGEVDRRLSVPLKRAASEKQQTHVVCVMDLKRVGGDGGRGRVVRSWQGGIIIREKEGIFEPFSPRRRLARSLAGNGSRELAALTRHLFFFLFSLLFTSLSLFFLCETRSSSRGSRLFCFFFS